MVNAEDRPRWYVIQTRAGMERTADRCIERLGFEHYLPMFSRMVSHAGRRERVARPLFPLYTFVRFTVDRDPWGRILRVVGVQTILGVDRIPGIPKGSVPGSRAIVGVIPAAKRPVPMPDRAIEELKENAAANHGYIELAPAPKPRLNPGDTVRITEGPFDSFEGLVDRDQKTRIFVLLDFLGREMEIPFERDSLELVRRAGDLTNPSVGSLTQNSGYAA